VSNAARQLDFLPDDAPAAGEASAPADPAAASGPDVIPFPQTGAHRCKSPMYGDPEPAVDWQAIAAAEKTRKVIPPEERQSFAEGRTLPEFYSDDSYGPESARLAAVLRGELAASTVIKDRQSLARWTKFAPAPPNWPSDRNFDGRPLAYITDEHVWETFAAMRAELALITCKTTWSHLRTIFGAAVKVRAIERIPASPKWPKGDDRPAVQIYSDDELAQVYEALAGDVDLQVAFVCAVNVGPRAGDLFSLRWEQVDLAGDRPAVEYVATKTGKRHRVPLAPVTVRQLARWRRVLGLLPFDHEGPLWPKLQGQDDKHPEASRPARARNKRFKARLASIGLRYAKPWQVARATCNERLERHAPGVGQFVLGHANTLNSRSYREPSQAVYEAIVSLPQPPCFEV